MRKLKSTYREGFELSLTASDVACGLHSAASGWPGVDWISVIKREIHGILYQEEP